MNRFISSALFAAFLTGPLVSAASAASVDDLVNLKANGLSDQLLIELIEIDGSSFQLTADDVIALHKRGLSDTVLRAMIRTGRQPVNVEPAAAVLPVPFVLEPSPAPSPVVVSVPVSVAVPVYVPVAVAVVERHPTPPVKVPEPVYWGFGGKLRPDAWKPAPEPVLPPKRDEPVRSSAKSR